MTPGTAAAVVCTTSGTRMIGAKREEMVKKGWTTMGWYVAPEADKARVAFTRVAVAGRKKRTYCAWNEMLLTNPKSERIYDLMTESGDCDHQCRVPCHYFVVSETSIATQQSWDIKVDTGLRSKLHRTSQTSLSACTLVHSVYYFTFRLWKRSPLYYLLTSESSSLDCSTVRRTRPRGINRHRSLPKTRQPEQFNPFAYRNIVASPSLRIPDRTQSDKPKNKFHLIGIAVLERASRELSSENTAVPAVHSSHVSNQSVVFLSGFSSRNFHRNQVFLWEFSLNKAHGPRQWSQLSVTRTCAPNFICMHSITELLHEGGRSVWAKTVRTK